MARPALRIRIIPKFPARIQGSDGIGVTRSGGVVTIAQDWSAIQDAPDGYDSSTYTALLQNGDGEFAKAVLGPGASASIATNAEMQAGTTGKLADAAKVKANAEYADFTQSGTGAVVRSIRAKLRDSVSVKDFGAVGNNIADDTAAIQAALDTGRAVYFPNGVYKTTSSLIGKAGNAMFGEGPNSSRISSTHAGRVVSFEDVDTFGVFIKDLELGAAGSGIGLYVATTLELSAHIHLENVRFFNLQYGTYGIDTYGMFDSLLSKVDFLQCSVWGFHLSGSCNTLVGCTFRVCGWGIYQEALSGFSIGGATIFGGVFIQNTFDVVIGGTTIRPLIFNSVWFEQTVNSTMGRVTSGEANFVALAFNNCLFQPAATATGNGIIDAYDYKGTVTFEGCSVFSSPYALATLPDATTVGLTDTNVTFARRGCYVVDSGGVVTPLYDFAVGAPSTRLFSPLSIGTDSPAASALLDLSSTTKGLLPPRMTSTQRDAISSPANGLTIYNSSTDKLQVRAAGAWVDLH